jgi:hypothetical protein
MRTLMSSLRAPRHFGAQRVVAVGLAQVDADLWNAQFVFPRTQEIAKCILERVHRKHIFQAQFVHESLQTGCRTKASLARRFVCAS